MEKLTDFNSWFEAVPVGDFEDVYALYRAVENGDDKIGRYVCGPSPDKSMWFVTVQGENSKLMLPSNAARVAFLSEIKSRYADRELTIDGWYQFKKGMSKHD